MKLGVYKISRFFEINRRGVLLRPGGWKAVEKSISRGDAYLAPESRRFFIRNNFVKKRRLKRSKS